MGQSSSNSSHHHAPTLQSNTLTYKLADIELQLIMHQLEAKEIIQFARCNRRLMEVADSEFAWNYSLLRVDATLLNLSLVNSSRLLRHPPLSLRLPCESNFDALLDLSIWSRVHEIHSFDRDGIHSLHFTRLLNLPSLQQSLRVLKDHVVTNRSFDESELMESMSVISSFPHLHTLVCSSRSNTNTSDAWIFISQASSLTSLSLFDTGWFQQSLLPYVGSCLHLKHLSLLDPQFTGFIFRRFFSSLNLRQLQSLTLDCFFPTANRMNYFDPIQFGLDVAAGFAALTSLHSLRITRVQDKTNHLTLPQVIHASALTLLTIDELPSVECLNDLLMTAPRLHLTIIHLPADRPCAITRKLLKSSKFVGRIHTHVEFMTAEGWSIVES